MGLITVPDEPPVDIAEVLAQMKVAVRPTVPYAEQPRSHIQYEDPATTGLITVPDGPSVDTGEGSAEAKMAAWPTTPYANVTEELE